MICAFIINIFKLIFIYCFFFVNFWLIHSLDFKINYTNFKCDSHIQHPVPHKLMSCSTVCTFLASFETTVLKDINLNPTCIIFHIFLFKFSQFGSTKNKSIENFRICGITKMISLRTLNWPFINFSVELLIFFSYVYPDNIYYLEKIFYWMF